MSNGEPSKSLDVLIQAVVNKQKYNQKRLGDEAGPYAAKLAKIFGPDLTEDQREEVFTQAFVELLQADPAALAKYGGRGLYRRCVRAAVRAVRASYAPAGRRTRQAKPDAPAGKIAAEDIDRLAAGDVQQPRATGSPRVALSEYVPDPVATLEMLQVEARMTLNTLLALAPPNVETALRRIHLEGEALNVAAAEAQVDRFTMRRQFLAFFQTCRAAA